MAAAGDHGVQEPEGGQRQGGDVVGEGPEQVALDGAQGAAGQADGVGGRAQVAPDQGDVAGLDGHVGAGAHGQAQVGLGQRGGVVDTVADHGDDPALGLQPADDVELVLGQDLGDDLVDADLAGDRPGRGGVVAGQQDRGEAERPQLGDGLGRGGLHRVGDDEHGPGLAVPAGEDGGAPGGLGLVLGRGQLGAEAQAPVGQEPLPAGDDGVAVDHALDAEALGVGEGLDRRQRAELDSGGGGDGPGDGVLGGVLDRADQAQHVVRGGARGGDDVDERHLARGHRAGLVEDDGVDPAGGLQDLGALDQDARAGRRDRCRPAARWAWPGRGRRGRR